MKKISEYLKKTQPIIYKNILNIFKTNRISHAYLIIGKNNNPLKQIAIFLAQSLICDYLKPLACEECLSCQKIKNNQYLDLIVKDGENKKIKKNDIDQIISQFSKTSMENKNKNIYIIHLIENMTIKATNALLKFLEEPTKNVYAFLTTKNEKKIMPTILSRIQKITLNAIPRKKIINNCKKNKILTEDAEILSYFYSDPSTINQISTSDDFIIIKKCLNDYIKNIQNENFLLTLENLVIPKILDKNEQITNKNVNLFLDLLIIIFEDVIRMQNKENIILKTYINIIKNLSVINHIELLMFEILKIKEQINNNNVNIASALEHLTFFLNQLFKNE